MSTIANGRSLENNMLRKTIRSVIKRLRTVGSSQSESNVHIQKRPVSPINPENTFVNQPTPSQPTASIDTQKKQEDVHIELTSEKLTSEELTSEEHTHTIEMHSSEPKPLTLKTWIGSMSCRVYSIAQSRGWLAYVSMGVFNN